MKYMEALSHSRSEDGRSVRRAQPLAELEHPDRIVILRLNDTACAPHVLNGTAAAIWQEIDGTRTPDEICTVVAAAYQVPVATVRADVLAYLDELRSAGLIAEDTDSI